MGVDLSVIGIGLKWDFIIVYESGYEWFGNNIIMKDVVDMWVQEGFINYSEELFMEYWFGKKVGQEYIIGLCRNIENDKFIIGLYGVNWEGSGDMYYKGVNMLYIICQFVDNDLFFRMMFRGLNCDFYYQIVMIVQVENYLFDYLGMDFLKIFDQYLCVIVLFMLELQ